MLGGAGWNNQGMQGEGGQSRLDLLLEGLLMLQYKVQQPTHGALCFRDPLRFTGTGLGAEQRALPLGTTKRGVVAKEGDVGGGEVTRGLAFEHVRVWGPGASMQADDMIQWGLA